MKTTFKFLVLALVLGGLTTMYSCSDDPEEPLSSEKDILSFSAPGQTGSATINSSNLSVVSEVECGTDLTNLAPTFTISEGAIASPASGSSGDYSNQVTIMVTAEDGTTASWKVTISEACANATDILTFSFPEETGAADIDNDAHTIDVEVENGTDLTKLTPTFTLSSGATSEPVSGIEGDYNSPVTISVTAEDGVTKQDWSVTVTVAAPTLSDATDILTFTLPEQTGDADIDDTNHTVAIEVENGADLTMLTPTFTLSAGASSVPASGTEGDYSSQVTITVTAEDGVTVQDWTVTVTEASAELSDATDIMIFLMAEQTSLAIIDPNNHTIAIEVINGTDLTNLTPIFLVSLGATSDPESGTAGDYSSEVTITVTAEDGVTVQDWKVNVSEAAPGASNQTDILAFEIPEQTRDALIDGENHKITVEVVMGTDPTSLTPTWTLSPGATSVPTSGTAGDYSSNVTITVTAEDGVTVQDWIVEVIVESDEFDASVYCQESLCETDAEKKQQCIDFITECFETEPEVNWDECVSIGFFHYCKVQ